MRIFRQFYENKWINGLLDFTQFMYADIKDIKHWEMSGWMRFMIVLQYILWIITGDSVLIFTIFTGMLTYWTMLALEKMKEDGC